MHNIRQILKDKDIKVLLTNFTSLTTLQVVGYIFPLITIPYLAQVIGVDKFGEIAFASAIIVYFQTLVNFGFNFTATRDVAKSRGDLKKVSIIFSNVIWARILLMIVSLIILLLLIGIVPKFREMSTLLLVSFLLIPGYLLFPEWLFQGLERMKNITILNVISKSFFTVLVFVFIKEKQDYLLQPLFISLGYIISGFISFYIITIRYKIKLLKPNITEIHATLKSSTDVFINQLFPNLYNSFSVFLLGFFAGSYANGILDAGTKFVRISQQLLNIISRVFFPFLSRNINSHKQYLKLQLGFAVLATIFLLILAPTIIHLFFTREFYDAIIVLRILAISLIPLSLTSIYGTNYMIIKGHEKALRNITIWCSVGGFLIAWPLIYYYNFIGAALTISLTRSVLGLLTMFKAIQKKHQPTDGKIDS